MAAAVESTVLVRVVGAAVERLVVVVLVKPTGVLEQTKAVLVVALLAVMVVVK